MATLTLISCKEEAQVILPEKVIEPKLNKPFNLQAHVEDYKQLKARVDDFKTTSFKNSPLNEEEKIEFAKVYIEKILVDSIFPYWLDTPWDFNGHTENPRDGEIACGYFVSTTLRDVGFKINRYRVAQKGATDIIKVFCEDKDIRRFTSLDKLRSHLATATENDILIIGLDYHVGFIIRRAGQHYFAHSNYFDDKVVIEKIEESVALKHTNSYVLGNLSANDALIKKWME